VISERDLFSLPLKEMRHVIERNILEMSFSRPPRYLRHAEKNWTISVEPLSRGSLPNIDLLPNTTCTPRSSFQVRITVRRRWLRILLMIVRSMSFSRAWRPHGHPQLLFSPLPLLKCRFRKPQHQNHCRLGQGVSFSLGGFLFFINIHV